MCTDVSEAPLPLSPSALLNMLPFVFLIRKTKMLSGGKGEGRVQSSDERLDDDKREGSHIGAPPLESVIARC